MNKALRGVLLLPAILFIVMGLRWAIDPAGAAGELGMPLLDGLGRSSQIGDLGAFFLGGGIMILIGVITMKRSWLYAPAMIVGLAIVFRLLSWLVHGAALAVQMIVAEVVISSLLLFGASKMPEANKTPEANGTPAEK